MAPPVGGPDVRAAVVLLPAPAWAGDLQPEEFEDAALQPWQVIGWGEDGASAKVRDGTLTVDPETLVMLREEATPSEWTGSANRLTGFDVEFRMRLGGDAQGGCTGENGTPPTLLWVGDTTDLLQIGFSATELCLLYPYGEGHVVTLDALRWHRYALEVRGQHVRLLVDGRAVLDEILRQTGGGTVGLGLETYRGTSTWDYVRYDTAPGRACTIRGTDGLAHSG
ncbi:hypothetical protein Cfla_0260 [Cellulomonas flavigena DSM 20109]|uniref:Uncharacterized protein n=1 Tax=Cellulomonas flavigena (strain ATCC 482 / DSM 20109 / BCRC 11376 / JCM 18109 / NBRC 3775 / NCIMB 8073 / NRS 134) TaxID=446466 RepID=D5UGJ6_CELFN|nr:hypothetical protein [Cellulomonas flavigena]ADG73179.1 hypothetical protein Cfla_0260 [Cellulomonas flavigena DSM 20109]